MERGRPTKWAGTKSRFRQIGTNKLDTIITGHLTQEQIDAYQRYFRVEEVLDLLRKSARGSLVLLLPLANEPRFQRDPSPPPQYDQMGNRTNTRETRLREKYDKERHALVETVVTEIKNYDPPADYSKPAKTMEKLYIPIKDYPDINFVGLLLGPRGNTLRQLQNDSGAKLAIRGKGSIKDGKQDDRSNVEDDLHVLITADTTARINKAIKLTNEVIEKAILLPMGQNDLKRDQLRELAVLNGTLRETKPLISPEMFGQRRTGRDVTLIVCRVCGNVGHYSRDCKLRDQTDSYSPRAGRDDPRGMERGDSRRPEGEEPRRLEREGEKRPYEEELPPWKRARTETPPWQGQSSNTPYAQAYYGQPPPNYGVAPPPSIQAPPPLLARPPPPLAIPHPETQERPPPAGVSKPPPPAAKPPPPAAQPPTLAAKPPAPMAKPPPPAAKPPPPPGTSAAPPPPGTSAAPPPPGSAPPPPGSVPPPPPPGKEKPTEPKAPFESLPPPLC